MHWPTKKLREIVTFLRGSGLSKKDLTPSGKQKCILYGQLYTMYGPVIDKVNSSTDKKGAMVSAAGDVLVPGTTTADEVGIAVASALNEAGVILGGDINVIRTKNKIMDSKFLAYLLSGPYKMRLAKYARGTNIIHLSGKDIARIEVPIPPKEIQKQIVERLDKIAAAQKLNDELIQKTDKLFQSLLHKELTGKDWSIRTLGEFFDITSSKRVFESEWTKEGIPFYRAREIVSIVNNQELRDPIFISKEMFEEYKQKYGAPQEGDILVTGVGTIGISYVVKKTDKFYFKDGNIIWLKRMPSSNIDSQFVEYFFRTPFFKLQLMSTSAGATVLTYTIQNAKKTKIPLPLLETQKQIATKLSAVQNYKKQLLEQKAKLKELFDSALAKSFKGELVSEKAAESSPAKVQVNIFAIQQAVGVVLQKGFERGEMVIDKVLYLLQEIYKVPLLIQFAPHQLGPWSREVKKAVTGGLGAKSKFFAKRKTGKGPVLTLGPNSEKLFAYSNARVLRNTEWALGQLLPIIQYWKSRDIECLATVCKIIQDNKTTDPGTVFNKMEKWKPCKFSEEQIKKALDLIFTQKWDKNLLN